MTSRIPVMEQDGFIICFEALPEIKDMRKHFVGECKWTTLDFNRIRNYAWFVARVTAWHDGEELGEAVLGGCCYKKESDFYTKEKDGYFKDLVNEAITKAKSKVTVKADPKGVQLKRDHGWTRKELAQIVADKYSEAYKGTVHCFYDAESCCYEIGGNSLPAAPSVQHLYPNGWCMRTTASEEEAIDIATGKTKLTGLVEVVETPGPVGNVTGEET